MCGEVDDYRVRIPALRGIEPIEFEQPVTFLVGENGSGKSTLIQAIAVAAEQTEHYTATRDFMRRRERMLRELLE